MVGQRFQGGDGLLEGLGVDVDPLGVAQAFDLVHKLLEDSRVRLSQLDVGDLGGDGCGEALGQLHSLLEGVADGQVDQVGPRAALEAHLARTVLGVGVAQASDEPGDCHRGPTNAAWWAVVAGTLRHCLPEKMKAKDKN